MNNIGRPVISEKEAFDVKFDEAYKEYVSLILGPEIDVPKLIIKYNLRRGETLISYKQWSAQLKSRRLVSQRKYLRQTVVSIYSLLLEAGADRDEAIVEVADIVKRSKNAINAMLRRAGFCSKKKQRKETLQRRKRVKEKFDRGYTVPEIADSEKTKNSTILHDLRTCGYKDHELNFIHNAIFDYRDLKEINLLNAHLWGIIWSDGSISNGHNVSIRLNQNDQEYLETISKSLVLEGSKYPKIYTIKSKLDNGRFSKNDQVGLSICRTDFVQYLERNLGLPRNKEKVNHGLPECILKANDSIFFSFLRGFMEGDGCITKNKNHPSVSFSCTSKVADELIDQLAKRLKLSVSKVLDKGSTYSAGVAGRSSSFLLLIHIYRNCDNTPIMKRKLLKALEMWDQYSKGIFNETIDLLHSTIKDVNFKKVSSLLTSKLKHNYEKYVFFNTSTFDVICSTKRAFAKQTKIRRAYIHRIVNGSRNSTSNWHCLGSILSLNNNHF